MEQHTAVELPKIIGQRVREIRQAKGWSQDRLSEETGHLWPISRSTVAKIESGTGTKAMNASVVEVCVLAFALDVPLAYLLIPPTSGPHPSPFIDEELFQPLPGLFADEVTWRNWVCGLSHVPLDRSGPDWCTKYGAPVDDRDAFLDRRKAVDAIASPWRRLSANMRQVITATLSYSEVDPEFTSNSGHSLAKGLLDGIRSLLDRESEDVEGGD